MKKFVITGGPGIGKTTVIELLASRGYKIIPEMARKVIEENQTKSTDVLPWKNLEKFQAEVFVRQMSAEEACFREDGEYLFMDRSIVDGYAYCLLGEVDPPRGLRQVARGRYDKVFVLDPLNKYHLDGVRYEDENQGKQVHQKIIEAYNYFSYLIDYVPVMSPEERVRYILGKII